MIFLDIKAVMMRRLLPQSFVIVYDQNMSSYRRSSEIQSWLGDFGFVCERSSKFLVLFENFFNLLDQNKAAAETHCYLSERPFLKFENNTCSYETKI